MNESCKQSEIQVMVNFNLSLCFHNMSENYKKIQYKQKITSVSKFGDKSSFTDQILGR